MSTGLCGFNLFAVEGVVIKEYLLVGYTRLGNVRYLSQGLMRQLTKKRKAEDLPFLFKF